MHRVRNGGLAPSDRANNFRVENLRFDSLGAKFGVADN